MRMTGLEKRLVNRNKKAKRNIEKLKHCLDGLETSGINDALELGCGIGMVSAFLSSSYGMNVYGTDFDPSKLELPKK